MMKQKNFPLETTLPASLGADYTSPTLDMSIYFLGSLQAVWTGGTVSGTFTLQISNDGVNWNSLDGSDVAASGAGSFQWNLNWAGFTYVRVKFTYTSGTGSLTVLQAHGKTL